MVLSHLSLSLPSRKYSFRLVGRSFMLYNGQDWPLACLLRGMMRGLTFIRMRRKGSLAFPSRRSYLSIDVSCLEHPFCMDSTHKSTPPEERTPPSSRLGRLSLQVGQDLQHRSSHAINSLPLKAFENKVSQWTLTFSLS